MTDRRTIAKKNRQAHEICAACARSRIISSRDACNRAPCLVATLQLRQSKGSPR